MKRAANPADFVETLDNRGRKRYRYIGQMYLLEWPYGRTSTLVLLWLIAALSAAVFVIIGVLPEPKLYQRAWFLAIYVITGWPMAMLAADAYKITSCKRAITRYDLNHSSGRLQRDAMFGGVLAGLMTLGQIITVVSQLISSGNTTLEYILLTLTMLNCCIYYGASAVSKRISVLLIAADSAESL